MASKVRHWGIIAAISGALVACQGVKGLMADEEGSATLKPVEMLLSKDKALRNKGHKEILKARSELIAQLSKIIVDHAKETSEPAAVEEVMNVLGDLRSPEAIDALVEHIGFPFVVYPDKVDSGQSPFRPLDSRMGESLSDYLPAIRALQNIGGACIFPVAKKLATTKNRTEYDACEAVLYGIDKPAIGVTVSAALDWAYANAADANRRWELSETRRFLGLKPIPEGFVEPDRPKKP